MNKWIGSIIVGTVVTVIFHFLLLSKISETDNRNVSAHCVISLSPLDSSSELTDKIINNSISTLKNRLVRSEYRHEISQPRVINKKEVHLDINIFGMRAPEEVAEVILRKGELEIWEMYLPEELDFHIVADRIYSELYPDTTSRKIHFPDRGNIAPEVKALLDSLEVSKQLGEQSNTLKGLLSILKPGLLQVELGRIQIKDTGRLGYVLRSEELLNKMPVGLRFYYSRSLPFLVDESLNEIGLYAIRTWGRHQAYLKNESLKQVRPDFDQDGTPIVNLIFNKSGAREWSDLTRKNLGRPLAIIVDDYVQTAPVVSSIIEGESTIIS